MSASGQPVYLHFLDRELGDAVGFRADPRTIEIVLKIMALTFSTTLYCGISIIWENPVLDDECRRFIALLTESKMLEPVSHSSTVEEFYESRQRLYAHDSSRYPLYFGNTLDQLRSIRATLHKPQGTTRSLVRSLTNWSNGARSSRDSSGDSGSAAIPMSEALRRRESQAVTYTYFQPFVLRAGGSPREAGEIRRQISLAYATNYLDFGAGDIATGIRGLSFFDEELSSSFPLYDVAILHELLDAAGLRLLVEQPWRRSEDFWHVYLFQLREVDGYRLGVQMRSIVNQLHDGLPLRVRNSSQYAIRNWIINVIRRYREDAQEPAFPRPDHRQSHQAWLASQAPPRLERLENRLQKAGYLPAAAGSSIDGILRRTRPVLIMTATRVESTAVMDSFAKRSGHGYSKEYGESTTFFRLGALRGTDIYLVQSEAGSGGSAGSTLAAAEAIDFLTPGAILLVGIAFGTHPESQKVGDILVSRQMVAYESQRVGSAKTSGAGAEIINRGERASASPRLLDRCRTAAIEWDRCQVHFGPILSGEKLMDNAEHLNLLTARFDHEPVGGEMEGAGVYAAASRRGVEWIVVKSISDWADGEKHHRKKQRQSLAATNVADFVIQLLGNGGLATPYTGAGRTAVI